MILVAVIASPVRSSTPLEPVRRVINFLPSFDTGVVPPVDTSLATVAGVNLTTVSGAQLTTV